MNTFNDPIEELRISCSSLQEDNERLRTENGQLRLAQLRIEAEIGLAPVVTRRVGGHWSAPDDHPGFVRTTHKARLVRIEEIKK